MPSSNAIRYDYEVHPLAALFPLLPADEQRKLVDDIRANGQLEPMTLDADGITLLDGRNRLRACKELGIPPRIVNLARDGISAGDFIWSRNILRRHLTADQRAAIGHKWSDAQRAAAKEAQKRKPADSVLADSPKQKTIHTRKAIAAKAHVSEHKVRQVAAVAKSAPHLLPRVESGEVTLKDAVKSFTVETIVHRTEHRIKDFIPANGDADKKAVKLTGSTIAQIKQAVHLLDVLMKMALPAYAVKFDPRWEAIDKELTRIFQAVELIRKATLPNETDRKD